MPARAVRAKFFVCQAAIAAVAAFAAASASAAPFDVATCSADSANTPPLALGGEDTAWEPDPVVDAGHLESHRHCPPADDTAIDGLIAQTRLNSGAADHAESVSWRFDAPAGTSITRLRLWRFAGKRLPGWELFTRIADGTKLSGSDCIDDPDQPMCVLSPTADWTIMPATPSVRIGLACSNAPSCATGATLHEAWIAIHRAIVTIDDPTPPTAAGAGGTLFAGGYQHGTATASLASASDTTGIKAVQVRVGDRVVGEAARTCDYTRRVPCTDPSAPTALSLDTRNIGDGTHQVSVGATDAADNFTAARTETVTVDNTAPSAPAATSPTAVTTAAPATTISWADPPGQVAPITTAHIVVCGPTGWVGTAQPVSGGGGSAQISLGGGRGTYTASVSLEDAAGNWVPGRAASWTINFPAATTPAPAALPLPTPRPAPTPAPVKASPKLALARPTVARDRRTVIVRGSVAPNVTGAVVAKVSARIGGRTRTVTRRAAIRGRRYSVRLRLPSTRWRTAKVTVRYAGSATRTAAQAARTVRQRSR